MVETLGTSVFPYLPKALEQLLAESEVLMNSELAFDPLDKSDKRNYPRHLCFEYYLSFV